MIKPILSGLNTIENSWGDNDSDFWIQVQAEIGPQYGNGSELFTFSAVSPTRLVRLVEENSIVLGRSMLIMLDFNINIVRNAIEKILDGIEGETWEEVANVISKYARWEFEGYKEENKI